MSFGEMLIDFVPTVAWVSLAEAPAFLKAPGGAPANVAVAVSRLGDDEFGRMLAAILRDNGVVFDSGARTALVFVGKLGDDEIGRMLAAILRDNGVVFDSGARTMLSFVTLRADGERDFMFYRNTSAADELIERVGVEPRDAAPASQTEEYRAYEMKPKQEVQSNEEPSKIGDIMESIGGACKSTKQCLQVIYGDDTTAPEQRKKSWPNYTLKALLFACAMLFSAYMNLSSSTSITIKILFVVDIVVFIIINALLLIKLPNWGNALACTSWFLLELAMCLLILPFNGSYCIAILIVLFLIVVVTLLQQKLQNAVKKYVLPSFTNSDEENDHLNHLFDISNAIATCGDLVTGILGHYSMAGPLTAAGFFFSTVLLGLYVMMVIAMRAVSPPHAACLTIVLMLLLLLTIITAAISFVC